MPIGYDPYQQNFQVGDALGGIGKNILGVLALFGAGGKGPLKFLQGLLGGEKKEEEDIPTQPLQSGIPSGTQMDLMGTMPQQMSPEIQRIMEMLRMFGGPQGMGRL
jgi:hypothetical protein